MLEKFALLKIALCRALVFSRDSSALRAEVPEPVLFLEAIVRHGT
jgi:hypothetical protein